MTTSSTPSTSTTTTTAAPTSAISSSSPARSPTRTPSSTTPVRSRRSEPELEPSSDLLGDPGRQVAAATSSAPGSPARRATSGRCRRPTTSVWPTTAITTIAPGTKVFAGQRAEGFYVDLGAIFDLGVLRPFEQDHTTFGLANTGLGKMAKGVNSTAGVNVHSIAIQVPISELTASGRSPPSVDRPGIGDRGVDHGQPAEGADLRELAGSEPQLGPVRPGLAAGEPAGQRGADPAGHQGLLELPAAGDDSQFASHVANPELAGLLPVLYPGVFPNLAAYNATGAPRADLVAILLTGIPTGVVPGFQNFTGPTQADMLRLNMAIPRPRPAPSNLGLIGGDPAGYPNGRRVFDDVATIELRAIAGATLPLVDPSFKPRCRGRGDLDGSHLGPHRPHRHGDRELPPQLPVPGHAHSGLRSSPPGELTGGSAPARRGSRRPSGEGTVVLDIGGNKGALILFTPESFGGGDRDPARRGSVGWHPYRRASAGPSRPVAYAGLFGSLPDGRYQVRIKGADADRARPRHHRRGVTVAGGRSHRTVLAGRLTPARPRGGGAIGDRPGPASGRDGGGGPPPASRAVVNSVMFYVLIFAILAVVLVAGGIAGMSRRRQGLEVEERHSATSSSARRNRKTAAGPVEPRPPQAALNGGPTPTPAYGTDRPSRRT